MVGMLLHAATLVRHHLVVFGETVAAAESLAAAESFVQDAVCHTDSTEEQPGDAGGKPPSVAKTCPVCLGLASAHALPASTAPPLGALPAFKTRCAVTPSISLHAATNVRLPQSRAPPSLQA